MNRLQYKIINYSQELEVIRGQIYHFEHRLNYNSDWSLSNEDEDLLEQLYQHENDLLKTIYRLKSKLK